MAPGLIDFVAKEAHFLDHLAPIWHALPDEARGRFYVDPSLVDEAERMAIPAHDRDELPLPSPRLTVVAALGDWRHAGYGRQRPLVLAQHGAGQAYSNRHQSYPGAGGYEMIRLFLVPNEQAAHRWRRAYKRIPTAVVGCPRVNELAKIGRVSSSPGRRVAAISFHWRCGILNETNTAFDHYASHLARATAELDEHAVDLIGHCHPRDGWADEIRPVYEAAGIEFVASFDDVVRRADVYAVDNSSTLFEFAALGRPVVVLNCPDYRRHVRHGLRFWDEAHVGLNVNEPDELVDVVLQALDDPPEVRTNRADVIDRVYVGQGEAAQRAAEAILSVRPCLVCGKAHASCGPTTASQPVDVIEEITVKTSGAKQLYPAPSGRGFIRATPDHARALGLTGEPAPLGILSSSRVKGERPVDDEPLEAMLDRVGRLGADQAMVDEARSVWEDYSDDDRARMVADLAEKTDDEVREAIMAEKDRRGGEPVDDTQAANEPQDKKVRAPGQSSAGRRRPKNKD